MQRGILKKKMEINTRFLILQMKTKKKKYADVWNEIKNKIKAMNDIGENDFEKDCMKIKFNSDNGLSLNKPLKFHAMTIINRSVFEENG